MRVLLVEDVPDIREVLTILLRAEGAEVVATGSGREAVDLVGQREFDVVLTDLGLPDIPGDLLIRQIRAGSTRRTRVLVITGTASLTSPAPGRRMSRSRSEEHTSELQSLAY